MAAQNVFDTTKQRLEAYGLFSNQIITQIARLAKKQAQYASYKDFFKAINISKPKLYVNEKGEGVSVVDIAAKAKGKGTLVLHLPMSNPLDANQLYHVATVVAANPAYRVIAFGNPSGKPFSFKQQNLTFWKRFGIGTLLNLRPLVSAELSYLQKHAIKNMHHIGYSYGAHKALIETSYLEPGLVKSVTLIDPVAHSRGIKQLVEDFQRTFKPLGGYVDRTQVESYFEARRVAAKTNHHKPALKRQINIAIGFMMARLDLVPRLEKVLSEQPNLRAAVAWGSKSELGNDAHLTTKLDQLAHSEPGRVKALRLTDDVHALANDIHLYAAIVLESISHTKKSLPTVV